MKGLLSVIRRAGRTGADADSGAFTRRAKPDSTISAYPSWPTNMDFSAVA